MRRVCGLRRWRVSGLRRWRVCGTKRWGGGEGGGGRWTVDEEGM